MQSAQIWTISGKRWGNCSFVIACLEEGARKSKRAVLVFDDCLRGGRVAKIEKSRFGI